ncbi:tol-pal system protein YbgF [Desulfovibrio sp. OttesenSCG-928-O18]|nr:tol-pal system protein YbgF [Desulfovibrio sp. OttesenSCG-928-O18]
MAGRFSLLLLFLIAASSGCASVSEERVAKLEATVVDLQVQDIRITVLENKVNAILAGQPVNNTPSAPASAQPELRTEPKKTPAPQPAPDKREPAYGPRRVEPVPVPSKPESAPSRVSKPAAQAPRDYQKALSTLEAGRPTPAMALFRDFLQAYPNHELAANAGYWLGECFYTLKQYDSAVIAFKDVVAQYPAHPKAADAMLKAGYSYALLGDTANARFYLEALLKDYPASRSASLGRARLASL